MANRLGSWCAATTGLKLSRETTPVAEAGYTRRSERLYQTKGSDRQSECVLATLGLPHARVRDEVAVREIAGGRRGRHYDAAGGQLAAAMLAAAHCSECGIRFKHMHSLRRHFRVCHKACVFPCDFCQSSFNRRDNLLKHLRDKHGVERTSRFRFSDA